MGSPAVVPMRSKPRLFAVRSVGKQRSRRTVRRLRISGPVHGNAPEPGTLSVELNGSTSSAVHVRKTTSPSEAGTYRYHVSAMLTELLHVVVRSLVAANVAKGASTPAVMSIGFKQESFDGAAKSVTVMVTDPNAPRSPAARTKIGTPADTGTFIHPAHSGCLPEADTPLSSRTPARSSMCRSRMCRASSPSVSRTSRRPPFPTIPAHTETMCHSWC